MITSVGERLDFGLGEFTTLHRWGKGVRVYLTPDQLRLVRLIADGYTYGEIGKELGVTARAAKYQVDEIRKGLGLRYKREIPRLLRKLGVEF